MLDGRRPGGPQQKRRVESLWALVWALGITPALDARTAASDLLVKMLPDLKTGEPSVGFRQRARLRPPKDLYAEADAHYLLTWEVRESELTRQPHPVDGAAAFDRRHALDWLIDRGLDWDDIPLDT